MNKYMEQALLEAKEGVAKGEGGPFGAIIVKDGKIVARAHNTVILNNDPTAHAEINVIRKAAKKLKTHNLKGCIVYTTGEPCPMCAAALKWANIEEFYYACSHDDADKIGFRDKVLKDEQLKSGEIIQSNIDREECLKLYGKWADSPLKKMY